MTSAQVVETSVKVTTNSPSQDYTHPDDHNLRTYDMTPGFKPFTIKVYVLKKGSYKKVLYLHLILNELKDLPGLIIDTPFYGSNLMTVLDFFVSRREKTGLCREVI